MLNNERRIAVLHRAAIRKARFEKIKFERKSWCERCQAVRWPTGRVNRSRVSEGIVEREFECLGYQCETKTEWVVETV